MNISSNLLNEYSAKGLNKGQAQTLDNSIRMSGAESADVSRLAQGSTLSGEVIAKDGNVITLRLNGDETLSAKLEANADINVGQRLTFEIAKAGNQTMLRPLYSNMASNTTVSAALDAASLPVNNTTVSFTSQMMKEGMPINKNALLDMNKNVLSFPNADPTTLVQMSKIGIELNSSNISQFENYKNFQHQIVNDANDIAEGLYNMLRDSAEGDFLTQNQVDITKEILNLVDTDSLSMLEVQADNEVLEGNLIQAGDSSITASNTVDSKASDIGAANQVLTEASDIVRTSYEQAEIGVDEALSSAVNNSDFDNTNLSLELKDQLNLLNDMNEILQLSDEQPLESPLNVKEFIGSVRRLLDNQSGEAEGIKDKSMPEGANGQTTDGKTIISDGQKQIQSAFEANLKQNTTNNNINLTRVAAFENVKLNENIENTVSKLQNNVSDNEAADVKELIRGKLASLIKSEAFSKLFNDAVKSQFSLKPADVAKEGKINELYDRILKTSSKVLDIMNSAGQSDSAVAKAAQNITDNVNFMDHLNQFVNYVQLPLKMAGENAHGDLYVYTKKKNLENNDGNFTAMLHLDMEHLGPMDVYVSMRNFTNVNTNFCLQTEELLDFIESHIGELTDRLAQKGYNSSVSVTKKNPNDRMAPIAEEFLKDESGTASAAASFSKMCFDVRA